MFKNKWINRYINFDREIYIFFFKYVGTRYNPSTEQLESYSALFIKNTHLSNNAVIMKHLVTVYRPLKQIN